MGIVFLDDVGKEVRIAAPPGVDGLLDVADLEK